MTTPRRHRTLLAGIELDVPVLPPLPLPADDPGPPPPCWLCGTIMALRPASIQWWCYWWCGGCDAGTGLRPRPSGPLTRRVTVAMGDGYNPPRMTVDTIDHSAVHSPSPA